MAASINMKHYIYKTIKQNKQFIRFCIVGGICTLLDASIYYLFCNSLGYTKSIIMGYLISLCLNYILTTYWTFSSKPTLLNAIGVIVVHLINCFIVRLGLMHLFIDASPPSPSAGSRQHRLTLYSRLVTSNKVVAVNLLTTDCCWYIAGK